jgi:hypothetical protein
LQIGEVLLTASMREVFLRLGDPVLAGDSALRKSDTERMLVESRQPSTLSQRQPSVPVEPARQFDLHRPLTLSRTQREAVQGLLIQFQGDAHVTKLPTAPRPDKAGPWLNSTRVAKAGAFAAHGRRARLMRGQHQDRHLVPTMLSGPRTWWDFRWIVGFISEHGIALLTSIHVWSGGTQRSVSMAPKSMTKYDKSGTERCGILRGDAFPHTFSKCAFRQC